MTAKLVLNEWTLDLDTGGGRFNLVWTSTYVYTFLHLEKQPEGFNLLQS